MMNIVRRHGGSNDNDEDGPSMGGATMSGMGAAAGAKATQSMGMMADTFHAGDEDALWGKDFVPSNAGAVFGACMLLFFFAILARFLDAMHRSLIIKWSAQANQVREQRGSNKVPFIARNDVIRGLFTLLHTGLLYLLMLAVMTYNVYYFLSIIIGFGVGETMFGRFGRTSGAPISPTLSRHRSTPSSEITPLHMHQHRDANAQHLSDRKNEDD